MATQNTSLAPNGTLNGKKHSPAPIAPALPEELQALVRAEVDALVEKRLEGIHDALSRLEQRTVSNKATIVVFSGDMDKVLAGLVIATGAAAMGLEVSMFHTFWGLMPLRKGRKYEGKNFLEKMMQLMTPAGMGELDPSRMSFAGAGAKLLRRMMKDAEIQSPEEMMELAREMGVKFVACGMSMDVMGIHEDELVEGVQVGGVAAYLGDAADSKVTLFI